MNKEFNLKFSVTDKRETTKEINNDNSEISQGESLAHDKNCYACIFGETPLKMVQLSPRLDRSLIKENSQTHWNSLNCFVINPQSSPETDDEFMDQIFDDNIDNVTEYFSDDQILAQEKDVTVERYLWIILGYLKNKLYSFFRYLISSRFR